MLGDSYLSWLMDNDDPMFEAAKRSYSNFKMNSSMPMNPYDLLNQDFNYSVALSRGEALGIENDLVTQYLGIIKSIGLIFGERYSDSDKRCGLLCFLLEEYFGVDSYMPVFWIMSHEKNNPLPVVDNQQL